MWTTTLRCTDQSHHRATSLPLLSYFHCCRPILPALSKMTDSSTTKKPSSGHSSDWNKWEFPAVPAPSAEDARSSCDEEMHDVDASFHEVPNCKDSMKKPNGKSLETVYWARDLQNLRQARKYRFKRRGSKTWYLWRWSTFDGYFANMEGKLLPATAHHDNKYSCQPWHPYHYIGGDNALKTPLPHSENPGSITRCR